MPSQSPSSFVSKIIQSNAHHLRCVIADDETGRKAYYYILVDAPKIVAYNKAMETGTLDLADYGKIIESGYGEPPEHIKKHMLETYGYDTDG